MAVRKPKTPDAKSGTTGGSRQATPPFVKVLLGAGLIAVVVKFTPIMEILTGFFYFTLIPMTLLAGVGMVSQGTIQAYTTWWNEMKTEINQRISAKLGQAA